MDPLAILLLSFSLSLIGYWLIGAWYVMPALRERQLAEALVPLLLVHSFRHVGMVFLVVGVVSQGLSERFATPAAYGDLMAALLAFAAIAALRRGWNAGRTLTWVANVVGTLDLMLALRQGLTYTVPGEFQAAYFIPILIVPALLVIHAMIFRLLTKPSGD
jgi:hypothetical protein